MTFTKAELKKQVEVVLSGLVSKVRKNDKYMNQAKILSHTAVITTLIDEYVADLIKQAKIEEAEYVMDNYSAKGSILEAWLEARISELKQDNK